MGIVLSLRSFDREQQKEFHVPIVIKDSGNPAISGTSTLTVIIGDVNDNKMQPGSKEIFAYNYMVILADPCRSLPILTDPYRSLAIATRSHVQSVAMLDVFLRRVNHRIRKWGECTSTIWTTGIFRIRNSTGSPRSIRISRSTRTRACSPCATVPATEREYNLHGTRLRFRKRMRKRKRKLISLFAFVGITCDSTYPTGSTRRMTSPLT